MLHAKGSVYLCRKAECGEAMPAFVLIAPNAVTMQEHSEEAAFIFDSQSCGGLRGTKVTVQSPSPRCNTPSSVSGSAGRGPLPPSSPTDRFTLVGTNNSFRSMTSRPQSSLPSRNALPFTIPSMVPFIVRLATIAPFSPSKHIQPSTAQAQRRTVNHSDSISRQAQDSAA